MAWCHLKIFSLAFVGHLQTRGRRAVRGKKSSRWHGTTLRCPSSHCGGSPALSTAKRTTPETCRHRNAELVPTEHTDHVGHQDERGCAQGGDEEASVAASSTDSDAHAEGAEGFPKSPTGRRPPARDEGVGAERPGLTCGAGQRAGAEERAVSAGTRVGAPLQAARGRQCRGRGRYSGPHPCATSGVPGIVCDPRGHACEGYDGGS